LSIDLTQERREQFHGGAVTGSQDWPEPARKMDLPRNAPGAGRDEVIVHGRDAVLLEGDTLRNERNVEPGEAVVGEQSRENAATVAVLEPGSAAAR
jgi:hypothetical protein